MTKLDHARDLVRIRLDDAMTRSSGRYSYLVHLLLSRARHDRSLQEALLRVACADLALTAADPSTIPTNLKGEQAMATTWSREAIAKADKERSDYERPTGKPMPFEEYRTRVFLNELFPDGVPYVTFPATKGSA